MNMLNSTAMTRSNEITMEQLKTIVPAVFAKRPTAIVSEKYKFISSIPAIEAMLKNGFKIVAAQNSGLRNRKSSQKREGFQKHMLRFQHKDARGRHGVLPEVVMINSHDTTSRYRLMAGLFRLVCGNGLILMTNSMGSINIRHHIASPGDIVQASLMIIEYAAQMTKVAADWQDMKVPVDRQHAMALAIAKDRYLNGLPFKADLLLQARRPDDEGNDLWHVYNRLQENITKGGLDYERHDRQVSTRDVRKIDDDVRYNTRLFSICAKEAADHHKWSMVPMPKLQPELPLKAKATKVAMDFKTAKTSELIAFYNKHSGKRAIKKFRDRASAEASCDRVSKAAA